MSDYDPSTYGDRWAEFYDEAFSSMDPTEAVDALEQLSRSGPVLELGIGTGRIALPLAARGVEVHGIDASEEIVAKLRAKPGGDAIPVTIADFADVPVDGQFQVIFVAFNTIFALLTQEAQVGCFQQAAQHLTAGGVFVVEAFVPDLKRFTGGQAVRARNVQSDQVILTATQQDGPTQRVKSADVMIDRDGVRLFPVQIRYAWPSELDLMAQLAGLQLRERWAGWDRAEFNAASTGHVSIYERA
jgi:SAM-dependent methyltransferase